MFKINRNNIRWKPVTSVDTQRINSHICLRLPLRWNQTVFRVKDDFWHLDQYNYHYLFFLSKKLAFILKRKVFDKFFGGCFWGQNDFARSSSFSVYCRVVLKVYATNQAQLQKQQSRDNFLTASYFIDTWSEQRFISVILKCLPICDWMYKNISGPYVCNRRPPSLPRTFIQTQIHSGKLSCLLALKSFSKDMLVAPKVKTENQKVNVTLPSGLLEYGTMCWH